MIMLRCGVPLPGKPPPSEQPRRPEVNGILRLVSDVSRRQLWPPFTVAVSCSGSRGDVE